ncbi:hypothetical protein QCA50_017893 [Cerrena zonata]|uniref:Uncharacterized protein n=1 Tax=Cerrena zonata TaxID=2478898 RepID=A0AAW0FEP2_9APHY
MSEQSFDLAEKLLTLNPKKRLTASEWHEFETKKRRRQERKKLQDAQKQAQFQERQLKSQDTSSTTELSKILPNLPPTGPKDKSAEPDEGSQAPETENESK